MGNVVIIWDTDTQEETPYGGDGSGWRKWKPCFPQTRRQWGLPETERTMAGSPLEVKGVQVLLTLWFWASCFLNSETVYLSLVPLFMILDRAALKLNQRWKCKEKEDSRLLGLDSQESAAWGGRVRHADYRTRQHEDSQHTQNLSPVGPEWSGEDGLCQSCGQDSRSTKVESALGSTSE